MFTFAQLSDPHIGPLPGVRLRDLMNKRAFGYANWIRKRRDAHGIDVLSALVDDVHAQKPDHIVVTGDLVNIGLPEEFPRARAWLDTVGPHRDVTVIPGNHDAYVPRAIGWFSDAWWHLMSGDEPETGKPHFPFVRRRGRIAFIGVSTAVATLPLMATGRVGRTQTAELAKLLATLRDEKLFRVMLIHHSPFEEGGHWHRRLVDGERILAVVRAEGAELILHGHDHRTKVRSIPGPDGPVPLIGAPAASELPRTGAQRGGYLLYRIDADGGCTMTERAVRIPGGAVETVSERRLIG
jgi:3',5'-cyclic AMP phosphodiesterase CpdA